MKRFVNNIISVMYSFIRFSIIKLFYWNRFQFHLIERFSPSTDIYFMGKGIIRLGKAVTAHSLVRLKVVSKGVIEIEDSVRLNYGCMVTARNYIHIRKGTGFGPNVLLFDHDHDYTSAKGLGPGATQFKSGKIVIGENCWIGANCILLKNTIIGNNCVVAAGSILGNCTYPDNTLIYQKKETATRHIPNHSTP